MRESIDKIKDDCEKEINETINVKCEEGLKNLTDSVNALTGAKLNEVRLERVSTVSMVEDFKTKNRNMFIDFKRLLDEKSDEISQKLNALNKSIEEMKRLQQSLSDNHKNIEVRQNHFEQNLNFLQSDTNIEKNSVSAKDVEEIVHKVIDSNLSNKPNVEIATNTQTENNGIHVHKVDHTVLSNSEKLQKCDIALLMDSNRTFIRKKFLFPSQYVCVAPCSTIQSADQILFQPKSHGQHTIIFHFGVNDIDNLTIEDIVDKMINITELCKGKYPDVKLYISGITPRRDSLNEKAKEVNRLLKDNIHRKKLLNVFFIDNDNLDNEELLYDNKHLKKDSGMRMPVSNLKRSVLKSTTKHYDYNYRKIKHHSLKESKHEVSVKKDPPQSRSVDMVEVRNQQSK